MSSDKTLEKGTSETKESNSSSFDSSYYGVNLETSIGNNPRDDEVSDEEPKRNKEQHCTHVGSAICPLWFKEQFEVLRAELESQKNDIQNQNNGINSQNEKFTNQKLDIQKQQNEVESLRNDMKDLTRDVQQQLTQMHNSIVSLKEKIENETTIQANSEASNNIVTINQANEISNENDLEQPNPEINSNFFNALYNIVSDHHNHDNESRQKLPQDTYTFLMCSSIWSIPFWQGVAVFLLQLFIGYLLFDDLWLSFPVNVERTVRTAQFLTMILAVLMQGDIRTSLMQIGEGYSERRIGDVFHDATRCKWQIAYICRFLVGLWGLIVTVILILSSDTVFDLLLNFTAMEFVCYLDDFFFHMASLGLTGAASHDKADEVKNKTYPKPNSNKKAILWAQIAPIVILICFAFFPYPNLAHFNENKLCYLVRVEFSDNVNIDLGGYSGFYALNSNGLKPTNTSAGRFQYVDYQYSTNNDESHNNVLGKFAFCTEKSAWTFSYALDDPCESWQVMSTKTKTFDLVETANKPWLAKDDFQDKENEWQQDEGRGLDTFRMTCLETVIDKLLNDYPAIYEDCQDGRYGLYCQWKNPCLHLDVELFKAENKLIRGRLWSTKYELIRSIQTYRHPIYVGEKRIDSSDSYFDLFLFTGRRWVLLHTGYISSLENATDHSNIVDYFLNERFHIVSLKLGSIYFISEPALDSSITPVGLKWYHAVYRMDNHIEKRPMQHLPLPDTNYPINLDVSCSGVCNNATNPCLFEGICLYNGTCNCSNGETGPLCRFPLINDWA